MVWTGTGHNGEGNGTMAREIKSNLTGDQIKAIIDAEQATCDAHGMIHGYMALARVLRVIAAMEVEVDLTKRIVPRKALRGSNDTNVWPPKDC